MTFTSFAQNFEDVILWRALKDVKVGRYLDIGAQDPTIDSVSRAFYDAGWRGIHVEPSPHYATELKSQRPDETVIQAVVAAKHGVVSFYEVPGSGLSTARPDVADYHLKNHGHNAVKISAIATTLDAILGPTAKDVFHWLKIDVEGFEGEVLKGWQSSPVRPWILVIEATYPTTTVPIYEEWESLVLKKGYTLVYEDGLNRFYLHESQVARKDSFSKPPNVFDDFQLSGTSTSITARLAWLHEQKLLELARERELIGQDLMMAQSAVDEVSQDLAQKSLELEQTRSERAAIISDILDRERQKVQYEYAQKLLEEADRRRHVEREIVTITQHMATRDRVHQSAVTSLNVSHARREEELQSRLASMDALLNERNDRVAGLQVQIEKLDAELLHVRALHMSREAEWQEQIAGARAYADARKEQFSDIAARLDAARVHADHLSEMHEHAQAHMAEQSEQKIKYLQSLAAQRTILATASLREQLILHSSGWTWGAKRKRMQAEKIARTIAQVVDMSDIFSIKAVDLPYQFPANKHEGHYDNATGEKRMKTIVHIGGLMILEGEEFVRSLYYNFLGRAPDEMGIQSYLYLLYKGVRKERLVYDIFNSSECRVVTENIVGLGDLLRRESKRRRFPGKWLYWIGQYIRPTKTLPISTPMALMPSAGVSFAIAGRNNLSSESALPRDSEILAAVEGLDRANKDICNKLEQTEGVIASLKKHIAFLVLQERILPPWNSKKLLSLDDRQFVDAAYSALVRRPCRDDEADYFLHLLEHGENKQAILLQLCEADEVQRLPSRADTNDLRLAHICAALEGVERANSGEAI